MLRSSDTAADPQLATSASSVNIDSVQEREYFHQLQNRFVADYQKTYPDINASKTVVIIPSMTIDQEILRKVEGSVYYEERLLCLLMLLRMPRTYVIYVTSVPVDPVIIDYYLHLLPGITGYHARQRLTMLCCFDASSKSLTEKILERPRLIERIKNSIPQHHSSHITCFNTTPYERTLAVKLNLPIFGCDPDLLFLGTKTGSRNIFKACNISYPLGYENLHDENDIAQALAALKQDHPSITRCVVKLNSGFSGDGNAIYSFEESGRNGVLKAQIQRSLHKRLKIIADKVSYDQYMEKFIEMGGIVEEYIPGEEKQSPSVQCLISPLGEVEILSTHDQVLGGNFGQVFLGANFPANEEYASDIGMMGKVIATYLKDQGVIGRFSIDFISVKENNAWKHYALELNLRKGGTTHPLLMLQGLTMGSYDAEQGIYLTANRQPRYYYCSDNVHSEAYRGLSSHDLIDIAINNRMQYDGGIQQGVMFHLIGALSQYGKLGTVCIGDTPSRAKAFYRRTLQVLNKEVKKYSE
jgi:hypothetical protein